MKTPFFGTKIVENIQLAEIEPFVNCEVLFAARWKFRGNLGTEEWERVRVGKALPVYERLMSMCRARPVLQPAFVYGYFQCEKSGNNLLVSGERDVFKFDFPRERVSPNRCVADFFADGFITIQLATVGSHIVSEAAELFRKNAYSETFFLKGLAAECAEATASFAQAYIMKELGAPQGVGVRFSPGYPSFPSLFDQRKIIALLGGKRIGVSLTRACMLVPEYSTTAIISFEPSAAHFSP